MTKKLKWGILSTARIGTEKVIPAMKRSGNCEITAIASRNSDAARQSAKRLGIEKAYDSYEALLMDAELDAIYNPLPNHMHVEWTRKAIEAGKHVLCEKPLALTTAEIRELIALRDRHGVVVGEAFMVHTHPQWIDTVDRIRNGELGQMKVIQGFFSYNNMDPKNIRNIKTFGGGGLWDIGVYPVHTSRWTFGEEPISVIATADFDPVFKTDVVTSAILRFPNGQASFHCSTQLVPHQVMSFFGTDRRLEIEVPFNAPNDTPCRVITYPPLFSGEEKQLKEFEVCDQYTLQGQSFAESVLNGSPVPVPLEDALNNVAVITALFRSMETGRWESPEI